MDKNDEERMRKKEWERNPTINFSDSVNRSMVGDPSALARGGCLTKVLTLVIIVIGIIILSRCSY
jgi:hypothetical protein